MLTSVSLSIPGSRLLDQRGSGSMLAVGFWRGIAETSPRPLLASSVNRDFVHVVFLKAEQNLPRLREVFLSVWKNEDHPLSPELFRWTGSGWDLA